MSTQRDSFVGNQILDDVLDTAHPPVGRFRLISAGLAQSHMLPVSEDISGYSACLSCGNCVDACPVIAGNPPDELVARTSMALEHVVGEQCRRCYKCIALCPQVDRPIKDYVRSFRRVERVVHWMLLVSVGVLALTGITIFHFREALPDVYYFGLGAAHRTLAIILLLAPVVYYLADRRHLGRAFRKTLHWDEADRAWLRDALRWAASFGREGRLVRGDFNTGQKLWYGFIILAVPLFAISGVVKWIGPEVLPKDLVDFSSLFHANLALLSDVLVVLHVCLKIVYPYARDAWRGISSTLEVSRLRSATNRQQRPRSGTYQWG
ncbi:MAG: cytochrome b/b6 domain-containing protein [Chloroflexi bacterium]|nr:cytochrome b/b6 domain-containing protein [Chloroflexota bacterium]